ncbi:MAG: hypothetical protein QXW80_02810 [Candidatus Micrarchaeia archaeon]
MKTLEELNKLETETIKEKGWRGYIDLINMMLLELHTGCFVSVEFASPRRRMRTIFLNCKERSKALFTGNVHEIADILETIYVFLSALYVTTTG